MHFTLTYDGELPSKARAPEKQRIRQAFHPQLAELWSHRPLSDHLSYRLPTDENGSISAVIQAGPHTFVALVNAKMCFTAELDILMLRPERPGGIILAGGDIDNRLKTLLDSLRAPSDNPQEYNEITMHSSVDDPIHTLLEDDGLITRISVNTDRLLNAPTPHHMRLVIGVTVNASPLLAGTLGIV